MSLIIFPMRVWRHRSSCSCNLRRGWNSSPNSAPDYR